MYSNKKISSHTQFHATYESLTLIEVACCEAITIVFVQFIVVVVVFVDIAIAALVSNLSSQQNIFLIWKKQAE